jgi:hypothetical protein
MGAKTWKEEEAEVAWGIDTKFTTKSTILNPPVIGNNW